METPSLDRDYLIKLAGARMPFGKYTGRRLIDLPESYILWLLDKTTCGPELTRMLRSIYEMKLNGLEELVRPIADQSHAQQ